MNKMDRPGARRAKWEAERSTSPLCDRPAAPSAPGYRRGGAARRRRPTWRIAFDPVGRSLRTDGLRRRSSPVTPFPPRSQGRRRGPRFTYSGTDLACRAGQDPFDGVSGPGESRSMPPTPMRQSVSVTTFQWIETSGVVRFCKSAGSAMRVTGSRADRKSRVVTVASVDHRSAASRAARRGGRPDLSASEQGRRHGPIWRHRFQRVSAPGCLRRSTGQLKSCQEESWRNVTGDRRPEPR